jgi:putative inorganic carbon (HCO3(-)) transporter
LVVSLLYYGVKGGFLAIMYGGLKKIDGPPGTLIGDNNHLAVALLMTLPLVNYLRLHTANRMLRLGLIAGFATTFLAIVSSYSRGAFLALGVLALVALVRSRNKFLYIIIAAAIAYPVFHFMPNDYYHRLSTLNDVDADGSFQGRVISWKVAFFYARDHFPLGAGFDGAQGERVYNYYFPDKEARAAHSIFFQVLGDTGFVGLAIYLVILFRVLFICSSIRKATRNRPELVWARDLATMIQLSLIAFCVGGSALSLAYYDMFFIWAGVLPPLRNLVKQTETQEAKAPAIGMAAFAPYANEGNQFASTYPTPGKA